MQVRNPKAALCEAFELDPTRVHARFHNIEHHRAHMASAFFVSPFPEAAILSVDGMGDFVSTMWGVGRDTTARDQRRDQLPALPRVRLHRGVAVARVPEVRGRG